MTKSPPDAKLIYIKFNPNNQSITLISDMKVNILLKTLIV